MLENIGIMKGYKVDFMGETFLTVTLLFLLSESYENICCKTITSWWDEQSQQFAVLQLQTSATNGCFAFTLIIKS